MVKNKNSSKISSGSKTSPKGSVTIKDLATELDLSITTISRALNGYNDVGAKTRKRVSEAAKEFGYRPNRNAQRLVTQRTHNIAWIQADNDKKFVDPHFVEVMAGVLRGARIGKYDIVLTSDTDEHQIAAYDRYVRDNSVDGFIVDLPQHNDPRIKYLLEAGKPFIVHSRADDCEKYSWVDIDNPGIYKRLTKLLIANGHRNIAFLNGDAKFTFASARQTGVSEALEEMSLPPKTVKIYNATHPMANAGYQLTKQALENDNVSAILYSSALMAVEGHTALVQAGRKAGKNISIATIDDMLNYLDLSPFEGVFTFVRSSLRIAGEQLVAGIIEQCENRDAISQTIIPAQFFLGKDLDEKLLDEN